jgi:hypothetical protein
MSARTARSGVILGLLLLGVCGPSGAADHQPLFPFVVSYETADNVTNISAWLERPAGKEGFVRVVDGRLAIVGPQGSRPIRFWATNLCFEGCFPSQQQAERLAARLARLGINCVRMHHMDNYSIWGRSPNKTIIDPEKLDRLDYLIYQLKQHGIYTNINLHVSRWLDEKEGFPHRQQRPNYDKGLNNFEPRMIELQKKYARDLLTHVNPYTKTAYVDEPAIAFVEINNENALMADWGKLDNLPDPYATTYRKLWNQWLRKKYGSTDKLREAWKVIDSPLGAEMLRGGDFSLPLPGPWSLETDKQTKVRWSVEQESPSGRRYLRINIEQLGDVPWRPQLSQSGFAVKKGQLYTLSFAIRSAKPGTVRVNCMMAHDPWQRLGLDAQIDVGPQWRQVRETFFADRDDSPARVTFTSFKPGTYELADVSLRPGGTFGLEKGQTLEDDTVPVPRRSQAHLTEAARADFADFLWETERDYWWGMYRFLKEELKVQSLVAGTQLGWSPVHIQGGLDYIDAHSYWQHPRFPGRPWDPANWTVNNSALVNSPPGTLGGLANRRVLGMAYTVSEYNHPEPNQYAAEGFPMIAALGAFQSWDAIYSFAYSHNADFEPRRITSFFDIKSVTPKLVHMPACAAMFLRGDVSPARRWLAVPLDLQTERKRVREELSARRLSAADFGLDSRYCLLHGVGVDIGRAVVRTAARADVATQSSYPARAAAVSAGSGTAPLPSPLPGELKQFRSDTGQILWDVSQPSAGYFLVDTPRSKLFTGFVRGRSFELGNVKLKIGPTRLDWATISMVCIDGQGFDKPGRILIAATGLAQNTGAKLEELPGGNVTLSNRWGSEPVLCEGVPAEITLPLAASRVQLFALDESGNRRDRIAVAEKDGRAVLSLDARHATLWYEVVVR